MTATTTTSVATSALAPMLRQLAACWGLPPDDTRVVCAIAEKHRVLTLIAAEGPSRG